MVVNVRVVASPVFELALLLFSGRPVGWPVGWLAAISLDYREEGEFVVVCYVIVADVGSAVTGAADILSSNAAAMGPAPDWRQWQLCQKMTAPLSSLENGAGCTAIFFVQNHVKGRETSRVEEFQ